MGRGGVRFRSGKALVPFRITGNITWGVPVPEIDSVRDVTCWCWPESLWAPISYTRAVLARDAKRLGITEGVAAQDAALMGEPSANSTQVPEPPYAHGSLDWHDWWCSGRRCHLPVHWPGQYLLLLHRTDRHVGSARLEFASVDGKRQLPPALHGQKGKLFLADASPAGRRPAQPLYVRADARPTRLSLGLSEKPVSFSPKAYDTRVSGKDKDGNEIRACDDKRVIDPALKEGALLTGVFNRLARSCFYGVAAKEGDEASYRTGCIPAGEPSAEVMEASQQAALAFEQYMYKFETHHALSVCDEYLRAANKRWSDASKAAKNAEDDNAMTQALVNAFHELRVATILMHGIVPAGCELICEYFDIDPVAFFSWNHIFESTDCFIESLGETAGEHAVKPLPPRFDFFAKHPSQY